MVASCFGATSIPKLPQIMGNDHLGVGGFCMEELFFYGKLTVSEKVRAITNFSPKLLEEKIKIIVNL